MLRRSRKTKRTSWVARAVRWILIIAVSFCLLTIAMVLFLRWINPPTTSMVIRDPLVSDKWLGGRWADLDDINRQLPLAVISSEDQKFPYHMGFDFEAIADALEEQRTRPRGASTITQQLAKNLFLWPGRSYIRKGLEAWFTLWMEWLWPKQRIMEVYLNVIEYGPGVYGVTMASERFFHKSPARLSRTEASLLAAVLPNPKRMSASEPSGYVWSRSYEIRQAMRSLGGISYLPW
ncbi:monofunctional biosynthetic peptidoglycan transglycosylase [Gynuella sp.]|uniref:monofunctional biosynthetic peptidoglycan transglycosylase n=1 Tax=Gynuella sp. TaxID=2969146 RepID=UPI003D0C39EA